jgi:hypothetical protein
MTIFINMSLCSLVVHSVARVMNALMQSLTHTLNTTRLSACYSCFAQGATSNDANGTLILSGLPPPADDSTRNFTLYLPTYSAVSTMMVGVEPKASLTPLVQFGSETPPVVVWGSSIAQGGAVTNAGMTWPANVQRILHRPLLNFGFSGSCTMQLDVASVIANVPGPKPAAFVMDCLPNMQQVSLPRVLHHASFAVAVSKVHAVLKVCQTELVSHS